MAVIAAFAIALHARTLSFGFSYLDDDALILEQQPVLSQPASVWRAFGRPYFPSAGRDHAYYRPLVAASFALDALRTGADPRGYRVTNLLLHALAAALLFAWLRRLGTGDGVAFFGGAVLALHPALTEAVAWIPGRNDSLLTVFALGSWLALLRARDGRGWPARVLHLVLWLAALFTKETAVVLPVAFLAHGWLLERRRGRALVEPWLAAGWVAAAGVYVAARVAAVSAGTDVVGAGGLSLAALGAALRGTPSLLAGSLGKLALPVHLSVLAVPEDTWRWPGVVTAAVLAAAFFVPGVSRVRLAFAAVCFVAFLAPSLPASNLIVLENRLYLPALGVILAVCELARAAPVPARAKTITAVGVLAVLATTAFAYAGNFRDRLTFSEAAVRGSPHSSLAHRNLGVAYHVAGDVARARAQYDAALAEDAGEPVAHNNLAVILMAQGDLAEAERHLRQELSINPAYAPAHHNLALVLRARGRPTEADVAEAKARALTP